MPSCCRCNASGQCRNCSCKKSKKECTNCLPSRRGHCANILPTDNTKQLTKHKPSSEDSSASDQADDASPPPPHCEDASAADDFTPSQDTDLTPTVPSGVIAGSALNIEAGTMASDASSTPRSPGNTPAIVVNDLPAYKPSRTGIFKWGEIDGTIFARSIDTIYDGIVHWKLNLFKTPSGKSGRLFVQELTRLFTAYGESSALEHISLKAAMVMPTLLLQKPHPRSRPKELCAHLERRLKL